VKNNIIRDPLFEEYAPLLDALNIVLVDIELNESPFSARMSAIIKLKDGEVGVNECAKVYNIIKARMEVRLAPEQDFDLEVSTPGLQRKIKDAYEFTLFVGKRIRVYDITKSVWFSGIIKEVKQSSVLLIDCIDQDEKKLDEELDIEFENISKAKLEYIWEDGKNAK